MNKKELYEKYKKEVDEINKILLGFSTEERQKIWELCELTNSEIDSSQ